jgi:hypothetical protein
MQALWKDASGMWSHVAPRRRHLWAADDVIETTDVAPMTDRRSPTLGELPLALLGYTSTCSRLL